MDELRPLWGLGRDTRHLGGQCVQEGQDTEEKQVRPPPTPPQLRADSALECAQPPEASVSQDHPGRTLWSSGSELDTLGGGGPGTCPALGSSHISVFPSLPPQDLREVGHPLSAVPLQHSLPVRCPWLFQGRWLSVASKHVGMT